MPDFFAVAGAQRACRAFRPDVVPRELVRRVLEAATRAPSAENTQPWRFIVVEDAARRRGIGELAGRMWAAGARDFTAAKIPPWMLAEVDALAGGGMGAAPVLVVVAADTTEVPGAALESSIWPAVQNLLLAATAEGLGSALTTLPTFFPAELAELVGLPEGVRALAVVPLGYPEKPLRPGRRRPVEEVAFLDRYGEPLR